MSGFSKYISVSLSEIQNLKKKKNMVGKYDIHMELHKLQEKLIFLCTKEEMDSIQLFI